MCRRVERLQFDRRGVCRKVAGGRDQRFAGRAERFNNPLLHHRVKDFRTQAEVFRRICCADAELDDPQTALREIDRVLAAVVRYRRPGYIELPRDMVGVVPDGLHKPTRKEPASNPDVAGRGGRRGRPADRRRPAAR